MSDNGNNDLGARDGERSPASVESKDANVLVDSFKVKLIESASLLEREMLNGSSSTSFFGKECCIYRVEEKFHELSHRAYIPDMVSIGPFHRGKGNLPAMEQYKLFNLRNLLTRMTTTTTTEWSSILEEWVDSMKCIEEEARKCYSEPINLSSNEFVKMMLVDGLFIIELFRKKAGEVQIDRDDPLFDNTTCNMSNLVHDLVLLENQLPMLVLDHLFNLPTLHNELCDSSNVTTLALIFFDLLVPRDKKVLNTDYEGKHLLDLLHKTFLNALPRPLETQNSSWKSIPSATELKRTGVKFKKGTTEGNFLDIKFTDGVLEVHPIIIRDQTATLLRNLIAFEQRSGRYDTYMTSYAALMKSIINSTSDVGFLRNQGIISNYLGDDEEFSNIWIELSCGVNTLGNFYYSELCDQVNTHYEKSLWHVWGETLKRDYLCKYVTGLAVLVFALILGRFFNYNISRKGSFVGGPIFMACVLSGLAGAFFALLASRMTNKFWSLTRTGENIVDREGQSGDGQYSEQGLSEVVLSDHSEVAISSGASTPGGEIPHSPIRVPSKASPGFSETVISDHSDDAITSGASTLGGDIPPSPIRVPSKTSPGFSETVLSDHLEDAISSGASTFGGDIPSSPIRVPSKASPGFFETVLSDHSEDATSTGTSTPRGDIPLSPIVVPSKASPGFSETILYEHREDATSCEANMPKGDIPPFSPCVPSNVDGETDSFDHDIVREDLTIGEEMEKGSKGSVYRGLEHGLLESLPLMKQGVWSDISASQLESPTQFEEILSIDPKPPIERQDLPQPQIIKKLAEGTKFRLVRCPKCRVVLYELPDVRYYRCGGCGTVLKAKTMSTDGSSVKSDEKRVRLGSEKLESDREIVGAESRQRREREGNSSSSSCSRSENREILTENMATGYIARYRRQLKAPMDSSVTGVDHNLDMNKDELVKVNKQKEVGEIKPQIGNTSVSQQSPQFPNWPHEKRWDGDKSEDRKNSR